MPVQNDTIPSKSIAGYKLEQGHEIRQIIEGYFS